MLLYIFLLSTSVPKSNKKLKLIICYISSGATNIAEVSSGFHQADWSIHWSLLLLSNQFFVLLYLFTFLLVSRTQLDCGHMQTSGQFKFALYITND